MAANFGSKFPKVKFWNARGVHDELRRGFVPRQAAPRIFRPFDKWKHFAKIGQTIETFRRATRRAGERQR
jgi:hypothetical protein